MNCWEFKNCGRIPGGSNVSEFGVCPAYTQKAGEECWLIPNTLCKGKVQKDVKNKKSNICYTCDFYASLSIDHKLKMEDKHSLL